MIKFFFKKLYYKSIFFYFKLLNIDFYFNSGDLNLPNKTALFYSQGNQDVIILNMIKNNLSDFDNLKIIDIGSNHPIKFNNTFLFEKMYGAEVFSIDAQNKFIELYRTTRKSKFINCAIGASRDMIKFYIPRGSNIGHENNMFASSDINSLPPELISDIDVVTVAKCPLIDVLPAQYYDILFIDVEGFEIDVLEGIDFSKFSFKIICIENNRSKSLKRAIRKLLNSKGYTLVGRIYELDDIFQISV